MYVNHNAKDDFVELTVDNITPFDSIEIKIEEESTNNIITKGSVSKGGELKLKVPIDGKSMSIAKYKKYIISSSQSFIPAEYGVNGDGRSLSFRIIDIE